MWMHMWEVLSNHLRHLCDYVSLPAADIPVSSNFFISLHRYALIDEVTSCKGCLVHSSSTEELYTLYDLSHWELLVSNQQRKSGLKYLGG